MDSLQNKLTNGSSVKEDKEHEISKKITVAQITSCQYKLRKYFDYYNRSPSWNIGIIYVFATFCICLLFKAPYFKPGSKLIIEAEQLSAFERNQSDLEFTHTWPNDELCSRFLTQFGTNFSRTFLASYPRSGNSWARYLIEGATGFYTGSTYNDVRLRPDFPGEKYFGKEGKVIAVKIHPNFLNSKSMEGISKEPIIYLIRNPYKAIASYWDYTVAKETGHWKDAHRFKSAESSYHSMDFRLRVLQQIRKWEKTSKNIIIKTKKLQVVFYEHLLEDPINELRKILKFLNINANEERLDCTHKHLNGFAKRNNKEVSHPYNEVQEIILAKALANVAGLLKLRNIEVPEEYLHLIANKTYLHH